MRDAFGGRVGRWVNDKMAPSAGDLGLGDFFG